MRVIAIVAAWNEERYVGGFIEHLASHGVETYLIDNESTDRTAEIAESYRGRGLAGLESLLRPQGMNLRTLLLRKEELALELDADWLVHADADEIRLPPRSGETLAEALARVDAEGYNAVHFQEFTFLPTQEAPDHDHACFQETMRSYYPVLPRFPHRLNAWKRQPERVELAWRGGHEVRFPGRRAYPTEFKLRHYLFLSREHAIQKYGYRDHHPSGAEAGWHGWRRKVQTPKARENPELLVLPSERDLRVYTTDDELDASNPLKRHEWMRNWLRRVEGKEPNPTPSYASGSRL